MKIFNHIEVKYGNEEDVLEGLTDIFDLEYEKMYSFELYTIDELARWNQFVSEWYDKCLLVVYCEEPFTTEEGLEYLCLSVDDISRNLKLFN